MRRIAPALTVFAMVAAPAAAAVLVVLEDGEVIRGQHAHREGEHVVITMRDHERVSVSLSRVVEVRKLEDEPPAGAESPSGIVRGGPRQLAGAPVEPKTAREQTAVLGEPARFPEDLSPRGPWPRSDWPGDPTAGNNFAPSIWPQSPLDPTWTPTAGFRAASVLSPSRSRWARVPVSPEWEATDAFVKHRAAFGTSTLPAGFLARSGQLEAITVCSQRIVAADREGRPEGTRVATLVGRPWEALPIPLYEVERRSGGQVRRTIFAVEGGACRPLAGDLSSAAAGIGFPPETTIRNYNRALLAALRPLPVGEPVARAVALATLADPSVMGAARERLVLLGSATDLDRVAAHDPPACELSPRARRRIHTLASPAVEPPVVARDDDTVVTLWTWSSRGGALSKHVARIGSTGEVAIETEPIARHLGDHRDEAGPEIASAYPRH